MKSISSILSVAVCFNALAWQLSAAENYSLWPRRPAELEQARRLLREQKGAEAVHLLQPFIEDKGIAGREARQITGSVNVQRYLSRRHPDARVYTVKSGDNVYRIAAAQKCPADLIQLLNGIVEPSGLRVGQKLVLVPMNCRMEIHLLRQEICVWDGDILVAEYTMSSASGFPNGPEAEQTTVTSREGYMEGTRLSLRSAQQISSDRLLVLENGASVAGEQPVQGAVCRLPQRDMNELALLLAPGARVDIFRK